MSHQSIPPYYAPVFYRNQEAQKQQQQMFERAYNPKLCKREAIFQGLLALGWVALGQSAVRNGWPLCLYISMGSLQGALQKHTGAISRLLMSQKMNKLDKRSV